jgi:hypothetical protein
MFNIKVNFLLRCWIVGFFLCLSPAFAFKPYTHFYLAEEVLKDAFDDDKLTIYLVDYTNGKVIREFGEYDVDPAALQALRDYPAQ